MAGESTDSGAGVSSGFAGALFLVFLTLRLTEHIEWSWWWVTAPLWGPLALGIAIILVVGLPVAIFRGRS